ncbi:DUF3830 family protein [Pseudogracilibacillus auburnensis]|uniref:Uncharacterized protein DUF3830 n=1 Tax=Pseudogracilibacillus auburnensis TaxID=1494959 RepID=A0A2V3W8A9_9BACI|nr:DUF3830 family protein [Pseudogracilibacillus auburnensis]PXW90587.1 uncharacterized protein DUF3830 [Pseudogracilibacillus auburnensis]
MTKYIKISLEKRNVSCIARLLEVEAPKTCEAVWNALPQSGQVYHAKYARNEIYAMVPRFYKEPVGMENTTVTPIPGDICFFDFESGVLDKKFKEEKGIDDLPGVVDLAVFYGRNNLLINADIGFVPGNVFATIEENLEEFAKSCNDIWFSGAKGETLMYERYEK